MHKNTDCSRRAPTAATKKQLRVIAQKDFQREQTNVLAVVDPCREIEELPEGLETGHGQMYSTGGALPTPQKIRRDFVKPGPMPLRSFALLTLCLIERP